MEPWDEAGRKFPTARGGRGRQEGCMAEGCSGVGEGETSRAQLYLILRMHVGPSGATWKLLIPWQLSSYHRIEELLQS